jgi:hypothetical protein
MTFVIASLMVWALPHTVAAARYGLLRVDGGSAFVTNQVGTVAGSNKQQQHRALFDEDLNL